MTFDHLPVTFNRLCCFSVVVLGFVAGIERAPAQTSATPAPDPTTTISVDARLVSLPVVVRDQKGALVQNLTKENFVLQVDGHAQTIRYFNQDTDLPLTLGLLVDVSQSQRNVLDEERSASTQFLDQMLAGPGERDKAFLIQFAVKTDLLTDVTSSKPKLQAGLKQLEVPALDRDAGRVSSDPGADNTGAGRMHRAGVGTTLYDALFLASDEIMSKQKGRRAVVILSDGGDFGSRETLAKSIEAAQKADTIVYAIYFKGRGGGGGGLAGLLGEGRRGGGGQGGGRGGRSGGRGGGQGGGQQPRPDGRKVLQQMADETGGRLFEVTNKETVAKIYTQIGQELRAQYRLGYTPDAATAADGYHQIALSLTPASGKNLAVQTRDGYYTGK